MQLQSKVFLLLVSRTVWGGGGQGCGLDNS